MEDRLSWVDKKEKEDKDRLAEGYFTIAEGDNRVQILTHMPPLAQMYDATTKKYRTAEEGEKGASIKGVCWVLHEGKVKQAKLPYTVVKAIRALQLNEQTEFDSFPMPYMITINAKDAGTKEVEYNTIADRKDTAVSSEILEELKKKPTPEEIIEKIKGKISPRKSDYPTENVDPDGIPF